MRLFSITTTALIIQSIYYLVHLRKTKTCRVRLAEVLHAQPAGRCAIALAMYIQHIKAYKTPEKTPALYCTGLYVVLE